VRSALPRTAAARRLFEDFLRRLTLRMPASAGASGPWEFLHASSQVDSSELAQLQRWHTQTLAGARVPLVQLYNLIRRIDRRIA